MRTAVTTYHLEMTDPTALRAARPPRADLEVTQAKVPCPELNRFFYTAVGGDWYWIDRLKWSYERWLSYVDRPELQTWIEQAGRTPGWR